MNLSNILYILAFVLAGGTIFAWYQFVLVVMKNSKACLPTKPENPFSSKCFIGALFFSLAFILAIYALYLI